MRSSINTFVILVLATLLSSCVLPISGAKFDPQDLTLRPDRARVIIFLRNSPTTGSSELANSYLALMDFKFSMDHEAAILLQNPSRGKGYIAYLLKPGKHLVTVYYQNNHVWRPLLKRNIYLQSGARYFWRLTYSPEKNTAEHGKGRLKRVNQQTAKRQLSEIRLDVIE